MNLRGHFMSQKRTLRTWGRRSRRIALKSAGFVTAIRRIRGRRVGRFGRFRVSAIGAHCLTSSYAAGLLFGGDSWVMLPGETEIVNALLFKLASAACV